MASANEELFSATLRHHIRILKFSENEARLAAELIAQSDAALLDKLQKADLTDFSSTRLESLLASIRELRSALPGQIAGELQPNLEVLANEEHSWEMATLEGASPIQLIVNSAAPAVLKAAVSSPINGIPLEGWLGKMTANDISRVEQQIRLGALAGETVDQMVRRLRGTRAGGFKDGVLSTTRREAEMIARTAVNHVSTRARETVWEANDDIIEGLRWVSTLDGRTSSVCQSRDGKVYKRTEGPRPPAHPNCRSTIAPVLSAMVVGERPTVIDTRTRAKREVDFRADAKAKAGEKWKKMSEAERRAAVKAQRDAWTKEAVGTTPSDVTYDKWLRGQSKEFQDEVLGKGKAELFRKGMSLDKFVDNSGKPYPLSKLQADLAGDKLNVLQPGVGMKAKSLLQQGLPNQEVLDTLKAEFPDANTSLASIASYKSELKKAGALSLGEAATVPKTGLAQAKTVASVVDLVDSSLPAGMKHAIGKQWATVVDDLDGSPGAYGYYEAGKGVMLSGKKLSAIPSAQAQQVVAHELGHMLHKQHDVVLPQFFLSTLETSAGYLSADAKKLYSYYLSDLDELVAEVYAQALSPSPLTSQGLSAQEFNQLFFTYIDEAKKALAAKFPVPPPSVKPPLPGAPSMPFEVAGKHTTVGSLAKALLQQGLPDEQVLTAVLAEFPDAKTKMASIQSYKSQLKKDGLLPAKGSGPVVAPTKVVPEVTPVAASPQVAVAVPEVVAQAPSAVKLTGPELKAKGMELMKSGVLGNSDIVTTLNKLYPLNDGDVNLGQVATWKSLWKKADPGGYAKAVELGKKVDKAVEKVADASSLQKPNLLGKPMGSFSTSVKEKIKGHLASGGSTQGAYDIMKGSFGSLKEPGATDLLELAQYELAVAKASGKPYMSAAMSKATDAIKAKTKPAPSKELLKTKGPSVLAGEGLDVKIVPARPASTPREGLPPPPRFTAEQRAAGIRAYATPDLRAFYPINAQQKQLGLPEVTAEEAAAIRIYTGGTYKTLNSQLRSGQYSNKMQLQAFVEAAQHGLAKMPKYKGLSSRGMTINSADLPRILSNYHQGAIVEEHAFVSSSAGENAAFGGNIFVKINGKTGVDVSRFSNFPGEREVLFAPGVRFRVDRVTKKTGPSRQEVHVIEMTEID